MKITLFIILLFIFGFVYADEIIVDNTPPIVTILSPTTANPAYNKSNETVKIVFNYSENNPENYTIRIYNTSVTICTKTNTSLISGNVTVIDYCILPTVNDGSFNITVNLTDKMGNSSSDTQMDSVIVDTVAPIIISSEPANNSEVTTASITLGVTTNEVAECRYSLYKNQNIMNMTPFANTNSTTHTSILSTTEYGDYNFYIKCRDPSNNINPKDYHIHFTVSFNFTITGRSARMNFVFHINNTKSDDIFRYEKSYVASYDISNVVLAIASSGKPIGIRINNAYSINDSLVQIFQSLENNRFIIAFTKGDNTVIKNKIYQLGDKKIPTKTFGYFSPVIPKSFPIFVRLEYDDIDITTRTGWSGSGGIFIKNQGNTDRGIPNITIEVIK